MTFTPETSALASSAEPAHNSLSERLWATLNSQLGDNKLVSCTLAAPYVNPAALIEQDDTAFLWAPSPSFTWVGMGAVACYKGSGDARFEQVRKQAHEDQSSSRACFVDDSGALSAREPAQAPRVFGGFAFAANEGAARWNNFADGRFFLPRLSYERNAASASLALTLTRAEVAERSSAERWIKKLLSLRSQLERLPLPETTSLKPSTVTEMSRDAWDSLVLGVLEEVSSGRASKVVTARCSEYHFAKPISLAGTLDALAKNAQSSTRFALRLGESAFVGASPERLIRKQGDRVQAEALAGTFRTARSAFTEELLRSPKEHSEHAPVLSFIVEQLQPLCEELSYPSHPELRALPDLLHLHTPITGRLSTRLHVLHLVERLHPTPAVGGVPRDVAIRWIRQHEPSARGWYSGPVGWFDHEGDGEFCVALRSGLLEGTRASLYAGAGIVAGSEPASEHAETELKLRAMYGSLRF
jgi:menaquinone-specific isochorismate synthase